MSVGDGQWGGQGRMASMGPHFSSRDELSMATAFLFAHPSVRLWYIVARGDFGPKGVGKEAGIKLFRKG